MSITSEIRAALGPEKYAVYSCSSCGTGVVINERVAEAWCTRKRCLPRGKAGRRMSRVGDYPTSTVIADQIEKAGGRKARRCKVEGCNHVHDSRGYCKAHARRAE